MTEEEARKALFQIYWDYIACPPKEKEEYYKIYKDKRETIKRELTKLVLERKEKEMKIK